PFIAFTALLVIDEEENVTPGFFQDFADTFRERATCDDSADCRVHFPSRRFRARLAIFRVDQPLLENGGATPFLLDEEDEVREQIVKYGYVGFKIPQQALHEAIDLAVKAVAGKRCFIRRCLPAEGGGGHFIEEPARGMAVALEEARVQQSDFQNGNLHARQQRLHRLRQVAVIEDKIKQKLNKIDGFGLALRHLAAAELLLQVLQQALDQIRVHHAGG